MLITLNYSFLFWSLHYSWKYKEMIFSPVTIHKFMAFVKSWTSLILISTFICDLIWKIKVYKSSIYIFNTNWCIAPSWVPLHHYSQVVYGELHSTEGWVTKHISDHSGFHYRQFLLRCLSQQAETLSEQFLLNYRNIVQKEMYLITDLIKSYPGHEALWYHRYSTFM